MTELAPVLAPRMVAALVGTSAAIVVATVLVVARTGYIRNTRPFLKMLAAFSAFLTLHHAACLILLFMVVRGVVTATQDVPRLPVLFKILALTLGVVIAWDTAMLLIGSAARRAGYGFKLFAFRSIAFTESAWPIIREDAVWRYRTNCLASGCACVLAAIAPLVRPPAVLGLTESSLSRAGLYWLAAFVAVQLVGRIATRLLAHGDEHPDGFPSAAVLREHPQYSGSKRRVLAKGEAAEVFER